MRLIVIVKTKIKIKYDSRCVKCMIILLSPMPNNPETKPIRLKISKLIWGSN